MRGGLILGQHNLFVKVETNQGIHGCAEGVDGVYGTYYVMKHIAEQHLVGKSPLDVHRLQEEMRRGGLFKGAQAGMYVAVMSALETALWDVVGKALGLPVLNRPEAARLRRCARAPRSTPLLRCEQRSRTQEAHR